MDSYHTAGGALIYRIILNEFPGLVGNSYLIVMDKYRVLVDTGSGFGTSNHDLEIGLDEISNIRGDDCSLKIITHIFITHGHIDHYGGLNFIKKRTDAKICIHEMDRRIVTNHSERLYMAAHRLEEFLIEAGVKPEQRSNLLEMYKITKTVFQSLNVDLTYEAMGMRMGPFKFIHVPGHCAGHVVILLHDVLFSGDHILKETSPHQSPQQITLSTGLDTYLNSLELVQPLNTEVKMTLGGHEDPTISLKERIAEIRKVHKGRLKQVLDFLNEPHTVADISMYLFGKVQGYTILLALEEAGAHVEYLYQRGFLEIINIKEIEENSKFGPIQYHTVDNKLLDI
jgi:glyoxylase-like metal-dependent hydrolase (beta-lactamase superfamily II)